MGSAGDSQFLFSVVIAVHNTERYIAEAIQSVLNQTIGIEHIQLVLVDDGSVDGSARICEQYQARYPGNIVLLRQDNAGVSAARNAGLKAVRGKYVSFLDSDDAWSPDTFEYMRSFFQENPGVRVAASKIVFFDAKTGNHRLNYKFKETRVIDLGQTYDFPQLSASSCLFDVSVFDGRAFDTSLSVSEDILFVNTVLIEDLRYGVVKGPTYYYRQRAELDSAVDTMKENVSWYMETPVKCHERLFELSRARYGRVLEFVQFAVMYDMQWRIRAKSPTCLNASERALYRSTLQRLLGSIDDRIICEQRTISYDYVAYALCLKYGIDMRSLHSSVFLRGNALCFDAASVAGDFMGAAGSDAGESAAARARGVVEMRNIDNLTDYLHVDAIELIGETAVLRGFIVAFIYDSAHVELSIYANNAKAKVSVWDSDSHALRTPFDDGANRGIFFEAEVPLQPGWEISLRAELAMLGEMQRPLRFRLEEASGLRKDFVEGNYCANSFFEVRQASPHGLSIRRHARPLSEAELAALRANRESYLEQASAFPQLKAKRTSWARASNKREHVV